MASLLELDTIMENTTKDPASVSPPDQAIQQARDLLGKIRSGIRRRANFYLVDEDNDQTEGKILRAWASTAGDQVPRFGRLAMELMLGSDLGRTATVNQILTASDTAIENNVNQVIPLLAQGALLAR